MGRSGGDKVGQANEHDEVCGKQDLPRPEEADSSALRVRRMVDSWQIKTGLKEGIYWGFKENGVA